MRYTLVFSLCLLLIGAYYTKPLAAHAQTPLYETVTPGNSKPAATSSASVTKIKKTDTSRLAEEKATQEVLTLFTHRPAAVFTGWNTFAYLVQYAVRIGMPANTVILMLLLPLLATLAAFVRHVIGLPSLGLLVPISLSITFLTIGIPAGFMLLAAILLASTVARFVLKRIRIMQLPKMAISVLVVVLFTFAALLGGGASGTLSVRELSIFPVLLLILSGERIVALQMERSASEATIITFITLCLGVLGFFLLGSDLLRKTILLYPELILFLIPVNIAIGRYFGLRLTEYFRFKDMYGSK